MLADAEAEAVRDDPSGHLWELPDGEGCAPVEDPNMGAGEPRDLMSRALAGAAMYALVENDRDLAEGVAAVLAAQPDQPGVDFADRTRWCAPGNGDNGPVFALSHALTSQLLAYDLLP